MHRRGNKSQKSKQKQKAKQLPKQKNRRSKEEQTKWKAQKHSFKKHSTVRKNSRSICKSKNAAETEKLQKQNPKKSKNK